MHAVIKSGSRQYHVSEGDTIKVERLAADAGDTIRLDQVLLVSSDQGVNVGTPTIEGAAVRATVLGDERGRKLIVFKYKRKNRYQIKTGHRQTYTRLRIEAIEA
ncbi:MAG: 50S ribosomal protein L21 [Anaerolineae bacterium]|jgi:large subunit ribosomal protein L21|nr:50S ribosomal protein L21 [Ardenticatenia bacterium]MBK8538684.1 50S ribosomal protein L21 [Ardenticatenia bacterium]HQZ71692.1 50S ribosomal protein L21 [Anaerolineae bacterium]